MKKLLLAAFATSVFAVSACASSGSKEMAKSPEMDKAWMEQVKIAEEGMAKLKKEDALWRDTGKFLKEAQEAHKAGDKDKASKLMKKVLGEIEMADKQHAAEKNAGPSYN
jgi:hypothetical protein